MRFNVKRSLLSLLIILAICFPLGIAINPVNAEASVTPMIATGYSGYSSFTLKSDGTVWTWGMNTSGQLGDGTTTKRLTPVQTQGINGVQTISTGGTHSLVLKTDDTVWAWGANSSGQLGDGTTTNRSTPVQVPGLSDVHAIAAGGNTSFAIKTDGTVWAWGNNSKGQLGDGTTTNRYTPGQVLSLNGVMAIAAGSNPSNHCLALKTDGTVWSWGYNDDGQLGDGTTKDRLTPVQVQGLSGVQAVSVGNSHSLALKTDGTVWAWGNNGYGQLGDGTTTERHTPIQVPGLSDVMGISSGAIHNIVLKSDGTIWTWGDNGWGQLGNGTTTDRRTPGQIVGLNLLSYTPSDLSSISASPSLLSIIAGQSQQLTVTANYSDGTTQDVTGIATYQSSDTDIATVSSAGLVTGIAAGTANITVTYDEMTTIVPVYVTTSATISSITAVPNPVDIVVDETQQLTVTAHYSDGATQDVTGAAIYQSDDTDVAFVDDTGLITGLAPGTANITVIYDGMIEIVPVTVYEGTEVELTGDFITLRTPQFLIPVEYDCAAGFTVTENGIDVPVTRVVVQAGTGGWPYSEIVLSLQRPVTMGSDVVVQYNADPNYPITPVDGGAALIPTGELPAINYSTVPFTMGSVTVPSSGDVVYIDYPTAVIDVDYPHSAGYVIRYGSTVVPITRVVTSGTTGRIYLQHPIPAGETVTVEYVYDTQHPITTVTGTPLASTTTPVTVINQSTSPVVITTHPVANGNELIMSVPTGLIDTIYQGNAGFRVFANGQEIPVLSVEVQGNNIILTLGVPIISGQDVDFSYTPDPDQPITTPEGTPIESIPTGGLPVDNESTVEIEYLSVDPDSAVLNPGQEQQITVTAHYSDGTTADVTELASYQSGLASVAAVTSGGLVTGVNPGSTFITVNFQGATAYSNITVNSPAPTLESITVTLDPDSLAKGLTRQLTVTAHYSDGTAQDVTNAAVYQSDNTAVATVSGSGLVTGVSQGTANITVSYQGKTAVVPVAVGDPVAVSISAEPNPVSLAKGASQQLTVTATLSDGTTQDVTGAAAYESNNTSIAAVSAGGEVTGVAQGSTAIDVVYQGRTDTVTVVVTGPVVESITVTPNPVNLAAGRSQQLTVTAHYSDGTTQDVTNSAVYLSDAPAKATVSAGGLVAGVSQGSANVTVTYQGKSEIVPVTVTAPEIESITVTPNPVDIPAGRTQQLTVTAHMSDGTTQVVTSAAAYQSDTVSKATVSAGGLVTGVSQGSANVTVTYQGKSVVVPVNVSAPVVDSITVLPASINTTTGKTQQLTVTAHMSDGSTADVTGEASYQSGNTAVAGVSSSGLVTAEGPGSTNVTVAYQGKTATVPVTVTEPKVVSISATPNPVNIYTDETQQLTVTAVMSDGTTRDVTDISTYKSVKTAVATVSSDGLVSGVNTGTTNITVTCQGKSTIVPVSVTKAPATSLGITIQPDPVQVSIGCSVRLVVTDVLSNGSSIVITSQASYQIEDTSYATITAGGILYGKKLGETTLIVTYKGHTYEIPVTVVPMGVIPPSPPPGSDPVIVPPSS